MIKRVCEVAWAYFHEFPELGWKSKFGLNILKEDELNLWTPFPESLQPLKSKKDKKKSQFWPDFNFRDGDYLFFSFPSTSIKSYKKISLYSINVIFSGPEEHHIFSENRIMIHFLILFYFWIFFIEIEKKWFEPFLIENPKKCLLWEIFSIFFITTNNFFLLWNIFNFFSHKIMYF